MKEHYLSITGKAYIETPLKENEVYSVAFKEVECYGLNTNNSKGENPQVTYKCRNLDIVTIINNDTYVIGRPRRGSMSQKLKMTLREYYNQQEAGNYQDFEQFYNKIIGEYIDKWKGKLI